MPSGGMPTPGDVPCPASPLRLQAEQSTIGRMLLMRTQFVGGEHSAFDGHAEGQSAECLMPRRVAWFASPYPEETLRSVIARYAIRTGCQNGMDVCGALFGACSSFGYDSLLPPCIGRLERRLDPSCGLTAEILLGKHTLYPYLASFEEPQRRESLLRMMTDLSDSPPHAPQRMFPGAPPKPGWSFCPKCIQDDIAVHGEAYEHRVHAAPGVVACPVHGTRIVAVSLAEETYCLRQRHVGAILRRANRDPLGEAEEASALDVLLARDCMRLLEDDGSSGIARVALRAKLREACSSWNGPYGDVDVGKLEAEIGRWMQSEGVASNGRFAHRYLLGALYALLGRGSTRHAPPVPIVLLLLRYLGVAVEELLS